MKRTVLTRVFAVVTVLVLVLSFAGCKAEEKMDEAVNGALSKVEEAGSSEYSSAQDIVDTYSEKMTKKAKSLGKELKQEAAARYAKDGTLSGLLKEKTGELTSIYGEGNTELSTYVLYSGDGESPTPYTDTLYDAYEEAESILMDAYQEALRTVK